MEILKFSLSGRNAFFKMPEVNTYYYFTYGNIHKVALLGIFGAILGYKGYSQMTKKDRYPEFYEKLKQLEIAIVPQEGSHAYIPKKVQSFNNTVGYASQEQGGNLIIKEQWLENPKWDIYLKIQDEESKKIKDMILGRRCIFMPYLGSNDHPADIKEAKIIEGILETEDEFGRIDSLFPEGTAELDYEEDVLREFIYAEYLPVGLKKETHMYQMRKFICTNRPVLESNDVYLADKKHLIFF